LAVEPARPALAAARFRVAAVLLPRVEVERDELRDVPDVDRAREVPDVERARVVPERDELERDVPDREAVDFARDAAGLAREVLAFARDVVDFAREVVAFAREVVDLARDVVDFARDVVDLARDVPDVALAREVPLDERFAAVALPPFEPAAFFCAVVPPRLDVERDELREVPELEREELRDVPELLRLDELEPERDRLVPLDLRGVAARTREMPSSGFDSVESVSVPSASGSGE
jgi:hypothetical protein